MLAWFFFGVFLWHFPYWLQFYLGSFSYTSRAGFNFIWGVSLTHPVLASFFFSEEFLLHIPCLLVFVFFSLLHIWLQFYLGSFFDAIRAGFSFIWGVSLTHPVLASVLSGEFLFHIPCWLHLYARSFSYASWAGLICIRGVCLTHPVLASFFIWGVSLTHPILGWFFFGEFLLHIPCWL